jgi:hypothetical protein
MVSLTNTPDFNSHIEHIHSIPAIQLHRCKYSSTNFHTTSFNSNEMVSFTTLASAISMALFASAAPTVMEARGSPPPTWSALDFTLFKSTDAGQEQQCWDNVADVHVPPADIGNCHKSSTFYTGKIYAQAWGYTCKRVFFPLRILL